MILAQLGELPGAEGGLSPRLDVPVRDREEILRHLAVVVRVPRASGQALLLFRSPIDILPAFAQPVCDAFPIPPVGEAIALKLLGHCRGQAIDNSNKHYAHTWRHGEQTTVDRAPLRIAGLTRENWLGYQVVEAADVGGARAILERHSGARELAEADDGIHRTPRRRTVGGSALEQPHHWPGAARCDPFAWLVDLAQPKKCRRRQNANCVAEHDGSVRAVIVIRLRFDGNHVRILEVILLAAALFDAHD
eukprot:7351334-Prymnesium_polylepis.1